MTPMDKLVYKKLKIAERLAFKSIRDADTSCDISFALKGFAERVLSAFAIYTDAAMDGEDCRAEECEGVRKFLEEGV